ncbi:Uncharacterised protein g1592 [Pycnogonum litorale]
MVNGSAAEYHIYLFDFCTTTSVLYNIASALGLEAEENRYDRDNYVKIMKQHLRTEAVDRYIKSKPRQYTVSYDYMSIMHASNYANIRSSVQGNSIVTTDIRYQYLIGNTLKLSFKDVKRLNLLYGCNHNCTNTLNCGNKGGYVGPNCTCICPEGTFGRNCEKGRVHYPFTQSCSMKVTLASNGKAQVISTPSPRTMKAFCAWDIEAPINMKVKVNFTKFSFIDRNSGGNNEGECAEFVEIRSDYMNEGKFFCGTELQGRTLYTSGSKMKILVNPFSQNPSNNWIREYYKNRTKGMSATVVAVGYNNE